jgi:hypothetical protein
MEYKKEENTIEHVHFTISSQAMQEGSSKIASKKCTLLSLTKLDHKSTLDLFFGCLRNPFTQISSCMLPQTLANQICKSLTLTCAC